MSKPFFISIAGIIGVGKTTLAQQLTPRLNAHLILEQYAKNPFWKRQLAGDPDADLPSELFFLMSRACQLDKDNINSHNTVICDYVFQKNNIFAKLNLTGHQLGIYKEVENSVIPYLATPQVVIYLYDSTENCLDRISRRGRDCETAITAQLLNELAQSYDNLFLNWDKSQIISINCSKIDLQKRENVDEIARQISICYDNIQYNHTNS